MVYLGAPCTPEAALPEFAVAHHLPQQQHDKWLREEERQPGGGGDESIANCGCQPHSCAANAANAPTAWKAHLSYQQINQHPTQIGPQLLATHVFVDTSHL